MPGSAVVLFVLVVGVMTARMFRRQLLTFLIALAMCTVICGTIEIVQTIRYMFN